MPTYENLYIILYYNIDRKKKLWGLEMDVYCLEFTGLKYEKVKAFDTLSFALKETNNNRKLGE